MNNEFITLHKFPVGELTLINVSAIVCVDIVDDHSFVSFAVVGGFMKNPSFYGIEVKESLGEICQMLIKGGIENER